MEGDDGDIKANIHVNIPYEFDFHLSTFKLLLQYLFTFPVNT